MKGWRGSVWLVFLSTSMLCAQDITNQTQFFFNAYSLNPAYAGAEGRPALFVSYRKQWANITGGPTIANLSFHSTTKMRLNYGLNFNSDNRGIVKTSSALVTFGYSLPVSDNTLVRFGASVGMGFNGVDVNQLGTFTDKILPTILNRNSFLMGNAGVAVQHKSLQGGISLPNLFAPVYVSADAFTVSAASPFQNAIIHVSNRFYFDKDKNLFEPYLMYRLNGGGIPSQLEVAGVVHLQHMVWVGASYRQNFGVSGLGGIKLKDQFAFGFSYSLAASGATQLSSPSYEIQLAYLMGGNKKNPLAYSFIASEKEKGKVAKFQKKTPRQLAEEKRRKEAELVRKEQEMRNAQKLAAQQSAAKKLEEERKAKELADASKKAEEERKAKELAAAKAAASQLKVDSTHAADLKALQRIDDHSANPNEEHGLTSDAHDNHERHEIVKRGTHHEEMEIADYVIVGSFSRREYADLYSKHLVQMGFEADFGFLSSHGKWYVYVFEGNDINGARAQRDKVRKLKIFKDAWLLTVTP